MKQILLFLFLAIAWAGASAQAPVKQAQAVVKHDVILKTNGEELTGKVVKVNENDIVFIYAGETLEYTIKKSGILKITHSSGRVEVINKPALASEQKKPATPATTAEERRNKVAILPFGYVKDKEKGSDEIGLKAQNDAYAYLQKNSAGLQLIDPRTVNALLIKHGVTKETIAGYTPGELCNLLGVEYMVEGTVHQTQVSQSAYSSNNHNSTTKKDKDDKTKTNGSGSSYSNASQSYQMAIALNIFNDKSASVYNAHREAFFLNNDGDFSGPLEYLLKRCPLYHKN